ncbi:MAG: RnfH family protein [Steroidobacteraceae bacterium]
MSAGSLKRCTVAYAGAERSFHWQLEVPVGADIAAILAAARCAAPEAQLPWEDAPVGIFGELRGRDAVPADGDRIELYRPLREDPRALRRARLATKRR